MIRKKSKTNLVQVLVVLLVMIIGGCSSNQDQIVAPSTSASILSNGESSSNSTQLSAADILSQDQVNNILDQIAQVLIAASEANDTDILSSRVTDPALEQRVGQIIQREKSGEDVSSLLLSAKLYSATVDNSWPRVLIVGTESVESNPAELYIITQADAKSDYKLENWVRVIGTNSVSGISVESGSKSQAVDAVEYALSARDTLDYFINYINDNTNERYQIFDDSTISARIAQEVSTFNDAVSEVGLLTVEAATSDYPITAVTLDTGEMLVSTGFTYSYTYQRTVKGSTLEIAGTAASYLEDSAVISKIIVNYTVNVVFIVPKSLNDSNIRVVGSERVITSVERDDSDGPD